MIKRFLKPAIAAFLTTLSTSSFAATVEYAPELLPKLSQLFTVLKQDDWNNFGQARMPVFRALNATAQRDDGEFYDLTPSDPVKIIRISGQIQPGDTDKLASLLQDPTHGYRSVIVMGNSPGGAFGESLKMGKLIHERIYFRQDDGLNAVFVLKGSECLSACAVAAAWAGKLLFVEQGARLGFHLPFFPEETAQEKRPRAELLDFAYDVAQAYNELLIEEQAHRDLFREVYEHRTATSFFYLDTPFKATRYGFSAVTEGPGAQGAHVEGVGFNLVNKLCAIKFDLEQSKKTYVDNEYAIPYFYGENRTLAQVTKETSRRWFASSEDLMFTDFRCHFGVDSASRVHVAMVRDHTLCQNSTTTVCDAPKLRQPSTVTNFEMALALACETGRYTGQGQRDVLRAVNARAEPSVKSKVISKLKPGQKVRIDACRLTGDKQSVWYKVVLPEGSGWASARYFR